MMTLREIAELTGGRIEGDADCQIRGVASLADATQGDISFLSNPRYAADVAVTRASAVLLPESWDGSCPCAAVRVKNPDASFARIAVKLGPPPVPRVEGIHPTAVIAAGARIGKGAGIGPYCVVEAGAVIGDGTELKAGCYIGHEAVVGSNCTFYPHVTLRERVRVGDRVIIHNGAVIGSDGFGYSMKDGRWEKIPQIGIVEIGSDVEIGANATVDRARFGRTVIEDGVKIDNLVQIAHNVRIGAHSALAAQVGISGSTKVGNHVQLAGQVGVVGHISIGDRTVVLGQAGVTKDIPSGSVVSGMPATPHREELTRQAHVARLPLLKAKLAQLEKKVAELEARLTNEAPGA